MNYLFLAYDDDPSRVGITASEREAFDQACLASQEELHESGYLLAAIRIQSNQPASTIRVRNGEVVLTDGAFDLRKEALVEVMVIDARDLNEAVRVAARMPQAQRGLIEVRAVAC